jgi:protein TonB
VQKKKRKAHYGVGPVVEAPPSPQFFTMVEQMPEFPGGGGALQKYFQDNVRYPDVAKESGIEGKVLLSFFVDADGSISDIRIDKKLFDACDREAVRVVSLMPRWKPYRLNGVNMKVLFQLPVEFKLVYN